MPSRRFGLKRAERGAPDAVEPMLDRTPVDGLRLPITRFGNLTRDDVHNITAAIASEAARWTRPTLSFAGGTALEFPGDPCVWAKLDGDLRALTEVARGVPQCVEPLGFFVDRRLFRPMMAIAAVTEGTVAADLEAVVDALDAFRGHTWTLDSVVLTYESFVAGRAETVELERIPIG